MVRKYKPNRFEFSDVAFLTALVVASKKVITTIIVQAEHLSSPKRIRLSARQILARVCDFEVEFREFIPDDVSGRKSPKRNFT